MNISHKLNRALVSNFRESISFTLFWNLLIAVSPEQLQ